MVVSEGSIQLSVIENDNGRRNDHRLSHLYSVDAGQNIDGVGTKYCKHPHVYVIAYAKVDGTPYPRT